MYISIGILFVLACVLFYCIGYGVANHKSEKKLSGVKLSLDNLVNQYNKDTGYLHEKIQRLEETNRRLVGEKGDLIEKIHLAREQFQSIKTDYERVSGCCKKNCRNEDCPKKQEPVKRGRKPKAK